MDDSEVLIRRLLLRLQMIVGSVHTGKERIAAARRRRFGHEHGGARRDLVMHVIRMPFEVVLFGLGGKGHGRINRVADDKDFREMGKACAHALRQGQGAKGARPGDLLFRRDLLIAKNQHAVALETIFDRLDRGLIRELPQ